MRVAAVAGATELLPHTTTGRRFTAARSVRLGDVDPVGRLRLDATARYLQDVATDDAENCALEDRFGWLVRRTLIDVIRPATLGEAVELTTSCTGVGRSWAERRTSIGGARGACVEAVSLWIQVDGITGRPTRLTEHFMSVYGEAVGDRTVSARLVFGSPPAVAVGSPWAVRRTDLDPFDHVNNAANWAFLEEAIGTFPGRSGRGEMEFVAPVDTDSHPELVVEVTSPSDGVDPATAAWLVADGQVLSAARWAPAP